MEEQGDLGSAGDGTEGSGGLPRLRPVAPTLPLVSEPQGGEGCLSGNAGVLQGSRDGVRTSGVREGTWAPRDTPGKFPALVPVALKQGAAKRRAPGKDL